MTEPDPKKLADETNDPFEQALLREARDVRASDDTRRATLAALGLAQAPSGASSGGGGGAGVAAKVALGAFGLVLAGVVGWLALGPGGASPEHPSQPPAPPATTVAAEPKASASAAPSAVLAPASAPEPVVSAAPPPASSSATALKAFRPQPSASGGTFADEVRLIDQARKAVYDRDKEAALRALDEYDRRFPPSHPGQMAADAAALRARARAL